RRRAAATPHDPGCGRQPGGGDVTVFRPRIIARPDGPRLRAPGDVGPERRTERRDPPTSGYDRTPRPDRAPLARAPFPTDPRQPGPPAAPFARGLPPPAPTPPSPEVRKLPPQHQGPPPEARRLPPQHQGPPPEARRLPPQHQGPP